MTCTGGGRMYVCTCVLEEGGVSDTPSAEPMIHSKLE